MDFEIASAGATDLVLTRGWAAGLGWDPGVADWWSFQVADPRGFLIGRLEGVPVASLASVRYGEDYGFLGMFIVSAAVRGRGYGRTMWREGLRHLAGRAMGLSCGPGQTDHFRRSGFRHLWNSIRYEGVPVRTGGAALTDARAVPFERVSAYDRRFFPAPRDAFLAAWLSSPDHRSLVAFQGDELAGFAVLRRASGAARLGPVYAASGEIAAALIGELAAATPGRPVAVDVPEFNETAVLLMHQLGLRPSFTAARMGVGADREIDRRGLFALTSLELG